MVVYSAYWLINIGKVAALRCLTQFCLKTCKAQFSPSDTGLSALVRSSELHSNLDKFRSSGHIHLRQQHSLTFLHILKWPSAKAINARSPRFIAISPIDSIPLRGLIVRRMLFRSKSADKTCMSRNFFALQVSTGGEDVP